MALTVSTLSLQPLAPIAELVVFGDSLSDVGNVFQATGGLHPPSPYFQGRYSNGRVWVEYLSDRLELSSTDMTNFAYGGATAADTPNALVPSLHSQVQSFLSSHSQVSTQINTQALYVIWIGANDYLQGSARTDAPANVVIESIDTLVRAGATRILVANLPNLGQLPATQNSTQADTLNSLSKAYNRRLQRSLNQLNQPLSQENQHTAKLKLAVLDVNALYRHAITNPAKYGLTNVTQACLTGSQRCDQPEQFLFWDGIHPTTAAHQVLGEAAFAAIQDAGMTRSQLAQLP